MKAPEVGKLSRIEWADLSKAQQADITADAVQELNERAEMKTFSAHNVPLAAFRDVYAVQEDISTKVRVNQSQVDLH